MYLTNNITYNICTNNFNETNMCFKVLNVYTGFTVFYKHIHIIAALIFISDSLCSSEVNISFMSH